MKTLPLADFELFFAGKNDREEKYFTLQVLLPRDVAVRLRRNPEIFLAGSLNPWQNFPHQMSNKHAPDKEPLSLQIPRTVKVRLEREARRRGIKVSELVTRILAAETSNIPISAKDYAAIQHATEQAEKTGRRLATKLDDTPRRSS